jgi:hypothetical protein
MPDFTGLIPRVSTHINPSSILQVTTTPHVDFHIFTEIIKLDSVETRYDFSKPLCEEFFLQADTRLAQV